MPIGSPPKLELPSRVRQPAPPDAEPAAPPPDAAPASPPPVEASPAPSADTISGTDLAAALEVAKEKGASKNALRDGLKVSPQRAAALLAEMEAKGIVGPAPKPGKKREILAATWPPEAAPVEPPPAEPEPVPEPEPTPVEPPPAEPEPAPTEPPPVEPPPAEPPPPETPPGTPETPPAAPAAETPKASAEATPETKPASPEVAKSGLRRAFERFVSKFKGEIQPEEEDGYKASWGDVTRNATMGVLSVVASYTGVKFIADLGAKGWQYIVSNPAERKRIQEIFLAKERELGETTEPTAIEQKKAKLEEAINASKFLTKEKKAELLARLNKTVDEYESKDKALHEERDGKILNLLKEAIQTRVKNTQLLKEGLNSALMVAGLSAMRGVAYGAVAGYERYKKVAQERAEGKREGGQFKEWIWKGFTETLNNLRGGKADTWAGKGMNFVKGATNVLRAAGFADLAIAEWVGEGRSVSSVIEKSLKAFEEKGYATAAWENIKAPWQRLGHLGEYAKSAVTGSEPPPAPWSTPDGATGAGAPGSPEAAAAAGAAGAAGVAAAEATPQVEIPEAQIEAGLVKKGDGILKILERQGVEGKSALEAAREAGIVRTAGDTRLTTEAIGRLSVFAEAKPEGGIEIKFLDTETDKVLTLAQAREAGFTYESGTAPGAIATEAEIVEHVPLASEAETLIDSPDVPNDLLGGTLHLYTDAQGHFTSLDPGDGDMFLRLNEALQELDKQGHGDSPEAKFIFEQYKQLLAMEDVAMIEEVPTAAAVEETTRRVVEERTAAVAAPEMVVEGEPLKIFRGESGRIKFVYDKDGVVKDAFLPAYTPRPRDIEDSLQEWGLTNKEVKAHFFEGAARTHMDGTLIDTSHPGRYPEPNPTLDRSSFPIQSPGNDYRQFVRDAEKLSRQESLLSEMEEKGLARTPEYARVKMETTRLESFVAEKMKKEFHIKERPI